jgi:site-specific DNA-methyltransferase (adenine-specific)
MNLFGDPDLARFQYFTPEWAAIELVERYFPDLGAGDLVLEPSAGRGAFLKAIPDHVDALGVELDPVLARECEANTGRRVISGDFLTVPLPENVTAIVGNPPFEVNIIAGFLSRAYRLLPDASRCGFLLPAYSMQTHPRVVNWLHRWSISVDLLPRRLFPRLRLPLIFATFTRNARREMIGMTLYAEAVDFDNLSKRARGVLTHGVPRMGAWRALVDDVLSTLGEASLPQLYEAIEPRRPTENQWWREKVRQQLQEHHTLIRPGLWAYKRPKCNEI